MADDDHNDLRFVSHEALEAHLCGKPVESMGMTFSCLDWRGHEGPCSAVRRLHQRAREQK